MVETDNQFSRAVKEGDLEYLKKASRKDINKKDEEGMTPVHWAAAYGKIEALRILIGKGGNPDKPNNEGETALHLAAGTGQLHCLVFLTNFGGNVYAVDDNGEAPMQTAATKGRRDCVRHLETLVAHQIMQDRSKVQKTQQKAKREADKRIREKNKLMQKLDKAYEKKSAKQKKFLDKKNLKEIQISNDDDNEDDEDIIPTDRDDSIENGSNKPSFSEITGVVKDRSETSEYETMSSPDDESSTASPYGIYNRSIASDDVMFERGFDDHSGSGYTDTTTLTKSTKLTHLTHSSQKDRLAASLRSTHSERSFIRNGKGNVILSESLPNMSRDLNENSAHSLAANKNDKQNHVTFKNIVDNTNQRTGSSETTGKKRSRKISGLKNLTVASMATLYTFLNSLGLDEYRQIFLDEKIDLKACLLCDEYDLREIGLPLGPRKIISEAIKKRNNLLQEQEHNNNEFKESPV